MTAAYFLTVGDYAERALNDFVLLQSADADTPSTVKAADAQRAAVDLVDACLALMARFPAQSRIGFASVLPFSELELHLIDRGGLREPVIARVITSRLVEWATRSPIFIDEVSVHAVDFLTRLMPLLDMWDQRQLALAAAERIMRAEGNADYCTPPKNSDNHLAR